METDGHDTDSRQGTKDYGQAPEARKEARKETSLVPLSLQREYGPADTLILDSGLQSSKKIKVSNLCLRFFSITTLEN